MKASKDYQEGASAIPPQSASGSTAPTPPPAEGKPAPAPAPPAAPEPGLTDLEWMPPPAEDRVARFLSDVAGIEAPQPREREANAPPPFLPPSASPEQAERKKARTEPFLSQVRATPMAPPRKAREQHRRRTQLIWLTAIVALLLLALVAVALALPHLHF